MEILRVEGLCRKEKENFTVNNISFSLVKHQKIAIAGATGSGKTTLLRMIAGLQQPSNGFVYFKEQKVLGPEEKLLSGHPQIAYLSQHFELRNNYRVAELMEMANKLNDFDAEKIYGLCRIEHLLQRKTNELSGGEKQRISLALLLTKSPQLLLLDEPFSNLDFIHRNIIKQVIEDVCQQLNISCILVSHDASDILAWADEILILQDGNLVQQGSPQQLYYKPNNEYCAGLLGDYNLIDASVLLHTTVLANNIANKKLLLRPEQILLTPASNIFQKDSIQRISFKGNCYLIDVLVGNQMIKVQVAENNFSVGDRVFLSVPQSNYWFI